jgi:hypothetical protein
VYSACTCNLCDRPLRRYTCCIRRHRFQEANGTGGYPCCARNLAVTPQSTTAAGKSMWISPPIQHLSLVDLSSSTTLLRRSIPVGNGRQIGVMPVRARLATVIGNPVPAVRHLNRCLAGTGRYTENPDRMEYDPMLFFHICQVMDEIHNLLPEC